MRWVVVALLVMSPVSAWAQFTWAEDFEGNLLETDSPPGPWDTLSTEPQRTVTMTSAAARNGARGLRFDDAQNSTANLPAPTLLENFTGTGDQSVVVWWRSTPSTVDEDMTLVNICIDSLNNSAAEAKWNPSRGKVFLICHDRDSIGLTSTSAGWPYVADGGFHLLEVRALGVGSVSGRCQLAIDSVIVDSIDADFSGRQFAFTTVSANLKNDTWLGQMDFDGYAAAPQLTSQMVLLDAGVLDAANCAPLTFAFRDGFGAFKPLGLAEELQATVTTGALFSDATCTTALPNVVTVDAGVTQWTVFVRAVAPTLAIQSRARAMLGTNEVLSVSGVVVDGGELESDGGPRARRVFGVGCACGSVDVSVLMALALVSAKRLKQRPIRTSRAHEIESLRQRGNDDEQAPKKPPLPRGRGSG
ncbi:MAG: hypothetical protein QM817_39985 [Archangium sp.]